MKLQKLLSVVTIGLLLGASGASMAQEVDDCADGVIAFKTVPAIVINGQSCVVYAAAVEGNVEVKDSPAFNMSFTDVGGTVTIENGQQAVVLKVDVVEGDISVTGYTGAVVAGSSVRLGSVRVNDNLAAFVERNTAIGGNIECLGNAALDAAGNRATGDVNCIDDGEEEPNL